MSWRLNKDCNILTSPAPPDIAVCRSRSPDAQPEARGLSFLLAFSTTSWVSKSTGVPRAPSAGCGFPYHISSLTRLISSSISGPRAPFAGRWLSLPHLVSDFSGPQLVWLPVSPSYIIVQSPTQSLEWHVWSSSSGNNCHAVQRPLSSGASVYEFIMGFYIVPFRQPNLPTQFLSITGHWNVSLPSGASLWNSMFRRVEGQYTTIKQFPNMIKKRWIGDDIYFLNSIQ